MPRSYLDHAATTPVQPCAADAVGAALARWANPSSPHREGRAARAALEHARAAIGAALDWSGEVLLTSGATEAIELALTGRAATTMLVSGVEHDAVLRAAPQARHIPVGNDGRVDPATLGAMLDADRQISVVAIQSVNSETGIVQPLDALIAVCRRPGRRVFLFADCAQSAAKLALPDADLIAVSAHKLGGPPGVGALLVNDLGLLRARGGQERGYRPGTENLPAAAGFAAALGAPRGWFPPLVDERLRLDAAIVAAGGEVIGAGSPRIATIGSYRMPGVSATAQLIAFDLDGFAVSAGSACASTSARPSSALAAMQLPPAIAGEVVRVSLGWTTGADELARFVDAWRRVARGVRRAA